jgi:hypothetical protein
MIESGAIGHHRRSIKRKRPQKGRYVLAAENVDDSSLSLPLPSLSVQNASKSIFSSAASCPTTRKCASAPTDNHQLRFAWNFGRKKTPAEITTGIELQQLTRSKGAPFRMGSQRAQHECSAKPEFNYNCIRVVDTTDAIGCAGHQSDDGD